MKSKKINPKLLIDTKKLFDDHHIEFWAMYGTLLGFVREQRIIPWDFDIDLSVWYYDHDKVKSLKKDFEKLGYKILIERGKYTPIYIINSDGTSLDITFWIKDKDKAVALHPYNKNKLSKIFDGLARLINQNSCKGSFYKSLPKKRQKIISKLLKSMPKYLHNIFSEVFHALHFFTYYKIVMPYDCTKKLENINVYGLNFKIPSNYKQYLELTYGKNWKVPDNNYSKTKWWENNKSIIKYDFKDRKIKKLLYKSWNK